MVVSWEEGCAQRTQNAVGLDLKMGVRWTSGSFVPLEKRLPMLSGRDAGARGGLGARRLGTRGTDGAWRVSLVGREA